MAMKLYGILGSNNVRRAYAVALHLGLDVELIEVVPRSPDAQTPEFRRMSPAGRVPAFADGDYVTDESHAIMLYLAEQRPDTLWPATPRARSQVMRWICWGQAHFREGWQPLQYERVIKPLLLKAVPDEAAAERALPAYHREATILDGHLAGRRWLVDERLSLADFSIGAAFSYATPARIPLEPYANIRAWLSRLDELPAWRQTAPRSG
jgi:glutathione S-transferase